VPWLRRLVPSLSPPNPGVTPRSIHVGFLVDKVALGQVFLRLLLFSPVNISFHRRSPNSYHVGDEQYVRQWQQCRHVVSPHNYQSMVSYHYYFGIKFPSESITNMLSTGINGQLSLLLRHKIPIRINYKHALYWHLISEVVHVSYYRTDAM
jgi:hypothetical protein